MDDLLVDPLLVFRSTMLMHQERNPFLTYPLFCSRIHLDANQFFESVDAFDAYNYPIFETLFELETFVDRPLIDILTEEPVELEEYRAPFNSEPFAIMVLTELHKEGIVVNDFQRLPFECSYAHYQYAVNNGIRFISVPHMNSWLLYYLNKEGKKEELAAMKETMKMIETAQFLVERKAPNFEVDEDVENFYYKIISESDTFEEFIEEFVTSAGGYQLTDNDTEYLRNEIARSNRIVGSIEEEIEIKAMAGKKAITISTLLLPIPVLSNLWGLAGKEMADAIIKIMKSKIIRENGVDWFVYLDSLKAFQSSEQKEATQCPFCNTSLEEAQNISDEEVIASFLNTGHMCIKHMILYADIRKAYALTGRELVIAIKKAERD